MGATIKEFRMVHALVVKQVLNMEEEKKPVEHPVELKRILEEFSNILH